MQKVIIWYGLLLKRNTKQITAWLMTAALLLLLLVVQGIHMPSVKTMTIGLYCEQDGSMERTLCEDLKNSHSRFAFVIFPDKEQMYKEVQSGKLECGFLMQSDFTERVRRDDWRKCVTYIANPFTTKEKLQKKHFLRLSSGVQRTIVSAERKGNFTQQDQKRLAKMKKSSDDFYRVIFLYGYCFGRYESEESTGRSRNLSGAGIFAVFLLGIMYFQMQRDMNRKGHGCSMPL